MFVKDDYGSMGSICLWSMFMTVRMVCCSMVKLVILPLGFSACCKFSFGALVVSKAYIFSQIREEGYWLYHKHAIAYSYAMLCYAIHYSFYFIFIITTLVGVKEYLTVVFISIPLISNDGEHIFMCLLIICIISGDMPIQVLKVHYTFWILESYQMRDLKYILQLHGLSFHFPCRVL